MVIGIVFGLINILIIAVIYIFLRRRIDRLTEPERITEALAGDLDVILSEINQATERNILIIEDKIRELEGAIEKAESRITLLGKKTVNTDERIESRTVKKEEAPKPLPAEPPAGGQLALEIPADEQSAGPGELTYSHLSRINTMSDMVTPLTVAEKENEESVDSRKRVLALHRNGIDSSIIAANLGLNRGEVELIISLYTQSGSGQGYK